jgi:hypothetical protein
MFSIEKILSLGYYTENPGPHWRGLVGRRPFCYGIKIALYGGERL